MDHDEWLKPKNVRALILAEVHGKHGYAAIVSECPACFEKSWVHHGLTNFYDWQEWPKGWEAAAKEEHARRRLAALRRFAASQCASCRSLLDGEVDTAPRTSCNLGGTGPATRRGGVETDCPKYKRIAP